MLRVAVTALAIVLGWIAMTALVLRLTGSAEAVMAVFPDRPNRHTLPVSVSLLGWSGHAAQLVGEKAGYVGDLYAAGALIVLPVRRQGCLALSADALAGLSAG